MRALILVPAGLRQQWIDELARHFRIDAVNADASWLRTVGRSLPPELNPWSPPGTYIASFDFVKRPEALRPLEALRWDLVIVDEAHAATVATNRRAAIDAIAQTSQRVVLLTATPPGDAVQFAALCQIGTAADDGGPVVFQRGSTEKGPGRRSIVLATHVSEEERRLHRLLERYTTLVWREAVRSGNAHALARDDRAAKAGAVERRFPGAVAAASDRSCWPAFGRPTSSSCRSRSPTQTTRREMKSASDDMLGALGLRDAASEQRWLNAVLDAALVVRHQSKARVLVRLLKRVREPALVFTEYRDTLEELRRGSSRSGHPGLRAARRARRDRASRSARRPLARARHIGRDRRSRGRAEPAACLPARDPLRAAVEPDANAAAGGARRSPRTAPPRPSNRARRRGHRGGPGAGAAGAARVRTSLPAEAGACCNC